MLSARIETALPCEVALQRIREGFHEPDGPHEGPLEKRVYGTVDGLCFSARRSATRRLRLQGELAGVVEVRAAGSTIRAHVTGADWAAVCAGAGLAAAFFFAFALSASTSMAAQFGFMVLSASCLGASLFAVGSVFADWRFLIRHVRNVFSESVP